MKVHSVLQGSDQWLSLRRDYFTASEAAAMMGASPYMTRAQLLDQKATGIVPDQGDKEYLFAKGHEAEAAYRPIAEKFLADDLYPVTGSIELDDLKLLASFDGLTMDRTIGFEHKLYNQELADQLSFRGEPHDHHIWQLEHQLLVSGAERILFVTSNGAEDGFAQSMYTSQPKRRARLIEGWKLFAADLATHKPAARAVRLDLERLVKNRKESIKLEIVTDANAKLKDHIAKLGSPFPINIQANYDGMKGLKTVDSLRNAADKAANDAIVNATILVTKIKANKATLDAAGHDFLFSDKAALCMKEMEDLEATIATRIAAHEARERAIAEAAERKAKEENEKAAQKAAELAEAEEARRMSAAQAQGEKIAQEFRAQQTAPQLFQKLFQKLFRKPSQKKVSQTT